MKDLKTVEAVSAFAAICSEQELYSLIDGMGGIAWRLNHDANRDEGRGYLTPEQADQMRSDAGELQKKVHACVCQTSRFGVDPVFVKHHSVIHDKDVDAGSPQYFAWYRWWKDYFTAMTNEEWRKFDNELCDGKDVSAYRPAGDWRARIEIKHEEQEREPKEPAL